MPAAASELLHHACAAIGVARAHPAAAPPPQPSHPLGRTPSWLLHPSLTSCSVSSSGISAGTSAGPSSWNGSGDFGLDGSAASCSGAVPPIATPLPDASGDGVVSPSSDELSFRTFFAAFEAFFLVSFLRFHVFFAGSSDVSFAGSLDVSFAGSCTVSDPLSPPERWESLRGSSEVT